MTDQAEPEPAVTEAQRSVTRMEKNSSVRVQQELRRMGERLYGPDDKVGMHFAGVPDDMFLATTTALGDE